MLGNRRHYGGMIVHFGIVIIALGLVGSGLFRSEASVNMAPGDEVVVAGERLRFEGVTPQRGPNYEAMQGRLTLLNSGREVRPERRQYMRQEMPMTESGIDSTLLRDVYVAMTDVHRRGPLGGACLRQSAGAAYLDRRSHYSVRSVPFAQRPPPRARKRDPG